MLTVNQLYFQRGAREFFHGLSFRLDSGALLQITGANGVGKTTLLRLLAGLASPEQGHITCAAKRAYLGHRPGFTPWLTVAENLQFTARWHAQPQADVAGLLERFGLSACRHLFPTQLSAGQQQRMAFAQLLLARATVWLLDEPAAALDQHALGLLQNLIYEHLAQQGSVVLTTHQQLTWTVPVHSLILQETTCAIWA